MTKTALLLDFDGVVSPLTSVPDDEPHIVISSFWDGGSAVRSELRSQLIQLDSNPLVDIVWASARDEDAMYLGQQLGLKHSNQYIDFSVYECPSDFDDDRSFFKLPMIAQKIYELSGRYRRFVWCEDEASDDDAHRLAEYAHAYGADFYHIKPSSLDGLQTYDIEAINGLIQEIDRQRHRSTTHKDI